MKNRSTKQISRRRVGRSAAAMVLAAALAVGAPVAVLADDDVPAAEEPAEPAVTQTPDDVTEPVVTPPADDTEEPGASGGSSGTGSDTAGSSSSIESGSQSSGGSENSGSLSEDGSSLSDSTSSEEEGETDGEKLETYELRVLVEEKGSVKVLFLNEDGEPAEAIVSSDTKEIVLQAVKNCEVSLVPTAAKDYKFVRWNVLDDKVVISEENTFTMPEEPVQITAVFRDKDYVEELSADGASPEALEGLEDRPEKTNEELIAEQHIVALPVPKADFRFWHTDREVAFAAEETAFREDTSDDAKIVARVPEDGAVFILEEMNDEWYYAESGSARGFIRADKLADEEKENELLKYYGSLARKESTAESGWKPMDDFYTYAEVVVPQEDNEAFLYRRCTSYPVVIDKVYALPREESVNILEEKDEEARVAGILEDGDLAYVIADGDEDWVYVESGDVRGFVKNEEIWTGFRIQKKVERAGGDEKYSSCTQKLKPEENKATYYTITSIKEGEHLNPVREAIIKSAEQCLGHPYVWGGTSLLGGCDCSGFVQGLYRLYGYSIPRVAENQALYGKQVTVDSAQPGDLIFFAQKGYVYHVALYVGDDQTIEAYDSAHGIIRNRVDHAHAVWATHVIDD